MANVICFKNNESNYIMSVSNDIGVKIKIKETNTSELCKAKLLIELSKLMIEYVEQLPKS